MSSYANHLIVRIAAVIFAPCHNELRPIALKNYAISESNNDTPSSRRFESNHHRPQKNRSQIGLEIFVEADVSTAD
jgi:hypothetical protein